MSLGKKTGGRDFVKGQPHPRGGRPPMTPEAKKIRNLTTAAFIEKFNELLSLTVEGLQKNVDDKTLDILTVYMSKCLLRGKVCGDYFTLDSMMNRIIGKVKEPEEPGSEEILKELLSAMIGAAKNVAKNDKKKK